MKRLLITSAASLGLLGGTVAVPVSATAVLTERTPRVSVISHGAVVQRAQPYSSCWQTDAGIACQMSRHPIFPRAAAVDAPTRVRIRIHYAGKPQSWHVFVASQIRRSSSIGAELIDRRRLPYRLRPHWVGGELKAWDVVVRLARVNRHYYFDTGGRFSQGYAKYALHLHT